MGAMSNPRAVLYMRVSTTHQATEGTSLESQYVACRLKAEQIGAAVVAVFEDAGVSGGDYATREGMQGALALIESGEADTLIVFDMSRYSRDAIHQQQILNRVLAAGGKLVFTTFDLGDLRDNPDGRLAFGVQGVFAEHERGRIRANMMRGRKSSAEKGLQVTHSAPFGYEIATRDKIMAGLYKIQDHKKYFIIEKNAAIVRDIFTRYAAGQSLYGIARDFNVTGVPSPKGGLTWRATSIRAMLKNPTYKGTAHFGKYSTRRDESLIEKGFKTKVRYKTVPIENRVAIAAPPVVSVELWDACQVRLKENQSRLGGRPERKHLLTSILRCARCGRKMHGKTVPKVGGVESIYMCQGASHQHAESRCKGRNFRGTRLEGVVIETIAMQLADPALLALALEKQDAPAKPPTAAMPKIEIHRQLKALEKQERATVQAQIRALQAGISSRVYEDELKRIGHEQGALAAQLHALEKAATAPKRIKTQAQRMMALWADHIEKLNDPSISAPDKNLLLFEIIASITPRHIARKQIEIAIEWRKLPAKPPD